MNSPTSYMEWRSLFDRIAADPRNEDYIQQVRQGSIPWTSGVAERFVGAAADMIRRRVNAAHEKYQRQMRSTSGASANMANALYALRSEYCYVYRLASVLPVPPDYRSKFITMVQEQADDTQASLLESARSDRTGRITAMVRNAHVNQLG